jgi:endonuclease/exonuclease/phosphatase family metal-dependent hydrolase
MRMVTWNCNFGAASERAEELAALRPDVVVLQECARTPEVEGSACAWFGDQPGKGVAVLAYNGFSLQPAPAQAAIRHSFFPILVRGPANFLLVAVWAQRDPTYAAAIQRGLGAYAGDIRAQPTVIAGDFNKHPRWDAHDRLCNHSTLAARLSGEFLVSAYHQHRGADAVEEATLYYRWQEAAPYHIDYCFLPTAWSVRDVSVGTFAAWHGRSDHRPLVVDVNAADKSDKLLLT